MWWGLGPYLLFSFTLYCKSKGDGYGENKQKKQSVGAFSPKMPPQPIAALGTALVLAYLAEPAGQPYLLHGHVIWENFIVKKELYLGGR